MKGVESCLPLPGTLRTYRYRIKFQGWNGPDIQTGVASRLTVSNKSNEFIFYLGTNGGQLGRGQLAGGQGHGGKPKPNHWSYQSNIRTVFRELSCPRSSRDDTYTPWFTTAQHWTCSFISPTMVDLTDPMWDKTSQTGSTQHRTLLHIVEEQMKPRAGGRKCADWERHEGTVHG